MDKKDVLQQVQREFENKRQKAESKAQVAYDFACKNKTFAELEGERRNLVFEIGKNMKYDEVKMQADIEKYGLFTYDDFVETGITYDQFVAFNGAYMKILIGRGIITWQDVLDTINNYIL